VEWREIERTCEGAEKTRKGEKNGGEMKTDRTRMHAQKSDIK
jgi:hypothetical protein